MFSVVASCRDGSTGNPREEEIAMLSDPKEDIKEQLRNYIHACQQHLTAIAATAQLAELRPLDEKTRADFAFILASSEELNAALSQMRDFVWTACH